MLNQCDAWSTVRSSRLEQCSRSAQYCLTVEAYGELYIVYRCRSCRDELVTKAESDGIEILDETPLPLRDLVITGKR